MDSNLFRVVEVCDSTTLVLINTQEIDVDVIEGLNDLLIKVLDQSTDVQTLLVVPEFSELKVQTGDITRRGKKTGLGRVLGYLDHRKFGKVIYRKSGGWQADLLRNLANSRHAGRIYDFEDVSKLMRLLSNFGICDDTLPPVLANNLPEYLS